MGQSRLGRTRCNGDIGPGPKRTCMNCVLDTTGVMMPGLDSGRMSVLGLSRRATCMPTTPSSSQDDSMPVLIRKIHPLVEASCCLSGYSGCKRAGQLISGIVNDIRRMTRAAATSQCVLDTWTT